MIDLLLLLLAGALVLGATYLPGWAIARLMGADHLIALAVAPPVAAAVAGVTAILAGAAGVSWNLATHLLGCLLVAALALGLRRLGVRVQGAGTGDAVPLLSGMREGVAWVVGGTLLSIVPIAVVAGRADAVLERWDTLYHLSALRRIRETGDGSSLTLGSISNSSGDPVTYPAAFHDLASVVPLVPVPVVLNASALVLAVVPWILGTAVLARVVFPEVRWAAPAAAVVAAIAPASPLDLWIHLSPIPNLVGFSVLPGFLAAVVVLWREVLARIGAPMDTGTPASARADAAPAPSTVSLGRQILASLVLLGAGGLGLALLHPNVAVTALILIAVLTAMTGWRRWRSHPLLAFVPLLALTPVGLLSWTPLASMVTGFGGGLALDHWWQGIGEIALGLLTVWPMPLGAAIAILWWPGLVRTALSPRRWIAVAWLVLAILYFDAAMDSDWNLSTLYYRGQDRLALPLTMIQCLLVVPGLQVLRRILGPTDAPVGRPLVIALSLLAVVVAGTSVPVRSVDAAKNLAEVSSGRGRFLQQDEREAFAEAAPQMRGKGTILANPFTGASHMYGIHGLPVHFPVAGMSGRDLDTALLEAAPRAADDPEACRTLRDADIGYIYQDLRLYARASTYEPLSTVDTTDPKLGRIVFETDHSRLVEIDCET